MGILYFFLLKLKIFGKQTRLAKIIFANLFYYSAYFSYYSWVSLHFLVLFMSLIVLFQLIFTFIYSTFNKKVFNFSKINGFQIDPKCEFYLVFLSFFFQWVMERFAAASVLVFDKFCIFVLNLSVMFLLTMLKLL